MMYAYSMLYSTATTCILGILFLFLSRQSGILYMRYWGICWLVCSVMSIFDFFNLNAAEPQQYYAAERLGFALACAWLFFAGTRRFFQRRVSRPALLLLALSAVLILISIPSPAVYSVVVVPVIILTASLLISSGCMFISYSWTQNLPEKIIASFLIILWAFFLNHFGFTLSNLHLAIAAYYIDVGLITVVMLLLLIIHFKKVHFLDNRQASRFRLLVEHSSDCMFLYDYKTRDFKYVSPAVNRVIGVTAEQLYRQPESFFDHLETTEKYKEALTLFSRPIQQAGRAVLSLVRRGQTVQWAEMHYTPIFDDTGDVSAVEGILRDITQQQLAAEKVRDTEAAKQAFIENITHEIRTPVTLIRGYARSMIDGIVPTSSFRTYLSMIDAKAVLLNSLLDDLRQVTDFNSQELEYRFYETQAADYFRNAIEQCKYQVEQSRHAFSAELSLPPDLTIIIDRRRIIQVLSNLINNAIRHTPEGKTIAITCRTEPTADDAPLPDTVDDTLPAGMIAVRVSDQGDGIRSEDLPHLFERGFRGRSRRGAEQESSEYSKEERENCGRGNAGPVGSSAGDAGDSGAAESSGGTGREGRSTDTGRKNAGLGLYISQQIIQQHSGQISAANLPEGGACFSFYLPYYT
jgi:two-component system sporulation sensor kinase C